MKKFFDLYYWFILSDAPLLALPTCCLAEQEVGKATSRLQSDAKGFFALRKAVPIRCFFEKQIDASAPGCREEKKASRLSRIPFLMLQ